jgi:PST family polysaccharide transporter
MRRGYLRMWRLQTMYGVVLGCVLAAVAPYLVPVVFGPGWGASIFPLQALAIYAAFRSLGMGVTDVLKSLGRPNLALGFSVARLAVLLPALVVATRFGIAGVAIAQVAVALLFAVLMQLVGGRLLGVRAIDLLKACGPAVVAGTVAAITAGLAAVAVPGGDRVRLAAGLLVAGVVAVAVLLGGSRGTRRDLRALLPRRVAAEEGA